jgi:hypothetical protein
MSTIAIITSEDQVPDYTLPDPLTMPDGKRVVDAPVWIERRRPKILRLFETHVYGQTPAERPRPQTELLSYDRDVFAGRAVRKQVRLEFSSPGADLTIDILIYLPTESVGPVPLFLGLNFWGNHSIHPDPGILLSSQWVPDDAQQGIIDHRATEASRGLSAARWPVDQILERGYGLATIYCGDLDPDYDDGFQNGAHALFPAERDLVGGADPDRQRRGDAWGAIGAWAWGLSRALDYLVQDSEVDGTRVAVIGHSRLGKAALWAGAQDERFAMVVSNNSGCGGAALSRRQFGETVWAINARFPHWFCPNFHTYGGAVDSLPVDQHMLLALIAPRPLYVTSAEEDLWADPRGEFLAAKSASPVYQLLGSSGLLAGTMPTVDQAILGTISYHLRPGNHDLTVYDWQHFLNFADLHL